MAKLYIAAQYKARTDKFLRRYRFMTVYKWQFAPRFRRHAFGWKSQPAIQRIKEAVSEIKQVSRKEPILAAQGAVLFLEKIAPAIEHVDSSSGAIGTAVNRAIETLAPIIAKAKVDQATRQKWLERLWQAVEDDAIPYLETLTDFWGELCAEPEIASAWADQFLPIVEHVWNPQAEGHGYFKGTTACLSALYAAGRHGDLLSLLEKARFKWWHYRRWGVKALATLGSKAEAIRYAEDSKGLNEPVAAIARACEKILLSSGFMDEAYDQYAMEANQGATHLATFRAIAKKYPSRPPETILRNLVARHPGQEEKWFAAAKDAGLYDFAIELATRSPTDPWTLIRAARDFVASQPEFALTSRIAGLRYIVEGHGYDITGVDVLDAYESIMLSATSAGIPEKEIKAQVRALISSTQLNSEFV